LKRKEKKKKRKEKKRKKKESFRKKGILSVTDMTRALSRIMQDVRFDIRERRTRRIARVAREHPHSRPCRIRTGFLPSYTNALLICLRLFTPAVAAFAERSAVHCRARIHYDRNEMNLACNDYGARICALIVITRVITTDNYPIRICVSRDVTCANSRASAANYVIPGFSDSNRSERGNVSQRDTHSFGSIPCDARRRNIGRISCVCMKKEYYKKERGKKKKKKKKKRLF